MSTAIHVLTTEQQLRHAYLAGRLRGEYEALLRKIGRRIPSISDARTLHKLREQGREEEARAGMRDEDWPE